MNCYNLKLEVCGFLVVEYLIYLTNISGERTLGVLTKIDLMDKGTDAVDVSRISSCFGIKAVLGGSLNSYCHFTS